MEEQNGILYIVATPIGNLGDMSARALEVLSQVDGIAAEDTRTTAQLLDHYGIRGVRMFANHKFNEDASAGKIVSELCAGKSIALVTDAGTPCISDPGYILVREAVKAGITVTAVPGCCAAVSAIAVSGFSALSFTFYGFLPRTAGEIRTVFTDMNQGYSPLVIYYESPNRILKTIGILEETLPGAEVCLCNDLTKKFERIYRGSPKEVREELESNPNAGKGEYVLLVNRREKSDNKEERLSAEAALLDCMVKNGRTAKEAMALLQSDKKYARSELYDAALHIKELFEK